MEISMCPNCSIEFDGLCSIIQTIMQWFGYMLEVDTHCIINWRKMSTPEPKKIMGLPAPGHVGTK
jgi:hypothetical protein